MSLALRFTPVILVVLAAYAKAETPQPTQNVSAPLCINKDANPNELIFVKEMKNPTPGGFVEQWKKERNQRVSAAKVCDDCAIGVEPPVYGYMSDFKAIASSTEQDPEFQIDVQKTAFGNYFYKDANGKKIKLTKTQAFEIMNKTLENKTQKSIDQKLDQSTSDLIQDAQNKRTENLAKKLSEQRASSALESLNESALRKNDISPYCVERTLSILRPSGNKRLCKPTDVNSPVNRNNPCITEEIVSYMTWSMNKAFECLNDKKNPLNSDLFFQKLNRESNFNFWIEGINGRGLGQMTFPGMQEVMGGHWDEANKRHVKYDGRKMLERIMKENKDSCEMYYGVMNPNLDASVDMYPRPYNESKCAEMSLDAGIQRNLVASIALYKFYRDEKPGNSSAKVMEKLKIPPTNPDYNAMKNLLALMSYSSINHQGAWAIAEDRKEFMKPNMTFEQFEHLIKGRYNRSTKQWEGGHPRAKYLRDIDNTYRNVQGSGEGLKCTGT